MLPDLSLLLSLMLGLLALEAPGGAPETAAEVLRAILWTAALTLVTGALCRIASDRALRGIEEAEPETALSATRWTGILPLAGWLGSLYGFGWGALVARAVPRTWFMLPYLLLFLPLALMLGAAWLSARRVEARLDRTAPSPLGALARGLRRNAIVLLPLFLLLALQDSLDALAALHAPGFRTLVAWRNAFQDFQALLLLLVLGTLMYFSPWLFRRVIKAEPLPAGDLRTTLERLSTAIGLRCKDFLVWKTGGRVVNAMVVGLTGRTRYVFLTDGILQSHPLPEIAAVVSHEAGHAKKHHLPLYFAVSLGLLLLMRTADEVGTPLLGREGPTILTLLFLAVFWFGFLGWLSRKFERQADAFGADHAAALAPDAPPLEVPGLPAPLPLGAALMIQSLKRIERRQGGGTSIRHGSIAMRTAFLAAYAIDPRVREAFRKDGRRLVIGIAVFVALALVSTVLRLPGGLVRGEGYLLSEQAQDFDVAARAALKKGDGAGANASFLEARRVSLEVTRLVDKRPDDPIVRLVAATAWVNAAEVDLRRLGRPADAEDEYRKALALLQGIPAWRASGDRQAAEIRFRAHVGLGRLALRSPHDPAASVKTAAARLAEATAVPEDDFGGPARNAWLRLLDAAIRLTDPYATDAQRAEAKKVLEGQVKSAQDGDDWDDLRADAADELKRATS